ncbi:MAG: dihydroorotate dehydrogenase [candidate division Zixibacteria bacterium]|nr:dihydroorotate dehydrogenase [candidate division Zixibacteria bacterium]
MKQKPDLSVKVAGVRFSNPVLVASGTFGYGEEYSALIDLSKLGGIITKSITLNPREGNPPPRTVETPSGMLNAIGLANVGVDRFIKEKLPFLRKLGTRVIVNVAGSTIGEYVKVVKRLNRCRGINMLEINISCPNVKEGGLDFGSRPQSAHACIKQIKDHTSYPIIAKLSPNVTNIAEIACAVEEAGADVISLINTLIGMAIDVEKREPILGNVTGGLSGPAIKPVALAMVWKVAKTVNLPVIGIGGIMNTQDALEFLLAGACMIQIGTGNFVDPQISVKIVNGLNGYLKEKKIKRITDLVDKLKIS